MILIAYVPVLHNGYLEWFSQRRDVSKVYVIGEVLLEQVDDNIYRKDIRRLGSQVAREMIERVNILRVKPEVLTQVGIDLLQKYPEPIVANDDDLVRRLLKNYDLLGYTTFDSTFLRWDKTKSVSADEVDCDQVDASEFIKMVFSQCFSMAEQSPDWWRQVGAVVVKDGEIKLSSFNCYTPHPLEAYFSGDPRCLFKAGQDIEISLALHAESRLIAQAACIGLALEGADLFVTTFPCANCARLISEAGFKRCFFLTGYSNLGGQDTLKQAGVEIWRVNL
jgi:dCMP deaminase